MLLLAQIKPEGGNSMLTNDNYYPEVNLTIAEDNYCPECDCQEVYQIKENEYYCKKCNCQWSE